MPVLLSAKAAEPGEWLPLFGEENNRATAVPSAGGSLVVEGLVKAKSPKLAHVPSAQANLEVTAELKVPEAPAQWASGAIALIGPNDRDVSYGMVIFNENGRMKSGIFGDNMVERSFKKDGSILMKLQVSDGEQRFKAWEKGSPEPAAWDAVASVYLPQIASVGMRTYAMKGSFSRMNCTEGNVQPPPRVVLQDGKVSASIDEQSGQLRELTLNGEKVELFRGDLGGPSVKLVRASGGESKPMMKLKSKSPGLVSYKGNDGNMEVDMDYAIKDGALAVKTKVRNTGDTDLAADTLQLNLGIDTCMISYPQWDTRHFPSFLRCEATHFWGYAMAPKGSVIGIFSPDPVSSWHLRYNNGGHRINGMVLDLMAAPPLPSRAPQQSSVLKPGEERSWVLYLVDVPTPADVPAFASRFTGAAFGTADKYTGEPGENISITLAGKGASVAWASDCSADSPIRMEKGKALVTLPDKPGFYRLRIKNGSGKESEMTLTVRQPWSWYMDGARKWTAKAKQKAGSHVEGWYGFFPSFRWRQFEPDKALDEQLDKDFNELFLTMYDYETMQPTGPALPHRIQNHACAASIYAQRYLVTGDIKDLERAASLCDFVIKTQKEDGAYRSGRTHYTSVIYIGKSIMEVMEVERKLAATDPVWKERYDRQYASVEKAMDELVRNLDNIETEGEMTFEDGMISCSYTQLAQWARSFATPKTRDKYVKAAEALVAKHRCLAQLVQPDSRMNNASLRFWESQYDVLWCPNLMGSPHGWSAWRLYGLFDLYRLTGKVDYLRQAMNGIGSCANLLDPVSGELHWAFMVDPRIATSVFTPDPENPGKGKFVPTTLGEQAIPMISQWWKAPYATPVFGYGTGPNAKGGSCDNDVHEIFKCVGEHVLPTTWLYVGKDGTPEIWNGKVERKGDTYRVIPSEKYVSEVHVNTALPIKLEVAFPGIDTPVSQAIRPGMQSVMKK